MTKKLVSLNLRNFEKKKLKMRLSLTRVETANENGKQVQIFVI